jgi:hypothetical protein
MIKVVLKMSGERWTSGVISIEEQQNPRVLPFVLYTSGSSDLKTRGPFMTGHRKGKSAFLSAGVKGDALHDV